MLQSQIGTGNVLTPGREAQSESHISAARHQTIETRPGRARGTHPWLWFLATMLTLASLALVFTWKGSATRRRSDLQHEASLAAHHFLQERFDAGVKLRYPSQQWVTASPTPDEYTVSGWLEATTTDGVVSGTYEYTCILARNQEGEWYLTNLNLSPQ